MISGSGPFFRAVSGIPFTAILRSLKVRKSSARASMS
jgi:hypothetical protein